MRSAARTDAILCETMRQVRPGRKSSRAAWTRASVSAARRRPADRLALHLGSAYALTSQGPRAWASPRLPVALQPAGEVTRTFLEEPPP